jgi:nucleoid DNA-binding protein
MEELIQRLARVSDLTPAEAADNVNELIHRIKKRLRGGRPARLRGLGLFTPGRSTKFRPEVTNASRTRSGGKTRQPC